MHSYFIAMENWHFLIHRTVSVIVTVITLLEHAFRKQTCECKAFLRYMKIQFYC